MKRSTNWIFRATSTTIEIYARSSTIITENARRLSASAKGGTMRNMVLLGPLEATGVDTAMMINNDHPDRSRQHPPALTVTSAATSTASSPSPTDLVVSRGPPCSSQSTLISSTTTLIPR
jgi:hypothetical protein